MRLVEDEIYQQMFADGLRIRFYGDYEEALDTPRPFDPCWRRAGI